MNVRKIIEIDKKKCNACGECIPSCAEHALFIEDNELKIREDKLCDGLGACLNACPKDALKIIEREAEEFDHSAVEAFEKQIADTKQMQKKTIKINSQHLQNWPVKLSLISSKNEILHNAHLLIAADCSAFACANFHKRYTENKAVLICCPRLENKESLVEKMAEIFREANCTKLDVVRMEVPCCVIPELIKKALEKNCSTETLKPTIKVLKSNGIELMPLTLA